MMVSLFMPCRMLSSLFKDSDTKKREALLIFVSLASRSSSFLNSLILLSFF